MLEDSLKKYCSSGCSRFHVPGHKGCFPFDFSYDVTELDCTDDLYNSNGKVKESELSISDMYGSAFSVFSTQGNTLCIQTMISLVGSPGKKMIVSRNSHKSVINTMLLLSIDPIWIDVKEDCNVEASNIEILLDKNPDVCAVLITSPDYFGVVADVKKIKNVCRDVPLLVDNSHGAHLLFFGMHPISLGADLCADSAHKTLPVLTGGAWLHIGNEFSKKFNINYQDAKNAMQLFGSTSPSFLTLLSLEKCALWMQSGAKKYFVELYKKIEKFRDNFGKIIFHPALKDPIRVTFDTSRIGYSSDDFIKYLEKFKIKVEFGMGEKTVLIFSPFNSDEDWNRLSYAVRSLKPKKFKFCKNYKNIIRKNLVSIRKAMFSDIDNVLLDDCEGRLSAQMVSRCPPGIPVLLPGDLIDSNTIEVLKNMNIKSLKVIK